MKGALRTFLLEQVSITQIISDRIYSAPVPQGCEYPFICLSRISYVPVHHIDGGGELIRSTWQIDCYSHSDIEAEQLMLEIKNSLDNFRGIIGIFNINHCTIKNVQDNTELIEEEQESRKVIEFLIIYK